MKIGDIEAKSGQKAFDFLKLVETHGGYPVHVPLHIIEGALDGPTLLVQAGVSGLEIEPTMTLPQVVQELDPARISGTLLVVPLFNTSGFEFEQENSVWDNKNLNTLGRGRADGTVSEQMIYRYYEQVMARADAVIDIHTGAMWGYFRYAGVYNLGDMARSRHLAVALGLPQVLLGQPEDQSMAFEAARDGKAVVSAWIGGGPGLRDYRAEDIGRVRQAVLNGMKHLGMLAGKPVFERDHVSVIAAHTVLERPNKRGFTLMFTEKRGQLVQAGEQIGYVRHPFTGDLLEEIKAPQAGILLHAGASWPVLLEDKTLAILGDLVEEVKGE